MKPWDIQEIRLGGPWVWIFFVLFIFLFNHFQDDFKAKLKTYSTKLLRLETCNWKKTVQQAYLGLHGDETMITTARQSWSLDGPTMEEVIVVFEIPDLQQM